MDMRTSYYIEDQIIGFFEEGRSRDANQGDRV